MLIFCEQAYAFDRTVSQKHILPLDKGGELNYTIHIK